MKHTFDFRTLLLPLALLAAALFLPWTGLRPNRIALPEFHMLAAQHQWLGGALLSVLAAVGFFRPRWLWLPASFALAGGFFLFGLLTRHDLLGQSEIARVSASTGFWLWMVGAGMALYVSSLALPSRRQLWAWLWVPVVVLLYLTHQLDSWSVLVEGRNEGERWLAELGQHFRLTLSALLVATLVGGPLAVWSSRNEKAAAFTLGLAGAFQTVPSLALLGLLIAPLSWLADHVPGLRAAGVSGIGTTPALVALTLYAMLPLLRNGVVALRGVDEGVLDAARGMGMTDTQRFWRVELPLALPVWLAGVRQAMVLLIGVTSVAALIGAGGLGVYIFKGLQGGATDLILLGAIPACLLAVLADVLLRALEQLLGTKLGRTT
ncbi:ABC transporter permease [Deinococcus cellulosilyticus]|uniref:ABC transporter permease n=1 Tax=Deinococcus cellulosilyticus (strain DSM 18568 / NBRC 106333 / KACC 11606 / 5516J-15) TaxID=1223518 RepID=A0A511N2V8_DEIC1|nr:ABC transporter permease [Deinococcus cellulosilyticus]GEM46751.1 ABC transporter permease [Deinococcus cellulosilyticus NBRC 106333 = KACC 11606]